MVNHVKLSEIQLDQINFEEVFHLILSNDEIVSIRFFFHNEYLCFRTLEVNLIGIVYRHSERCKEYVILNDENDGIESSERSDN